ncbi:MBL fold metallo-hydrolase [Skermanella mucosa]|uniref:MBL fold metallo-hydrolase n=1 Tax=Skermanella mucosa TaxID=1789672 RepID=UPI00192C3C3C|nr:MBL fold metallo-hydrolase [Skermanella mucosa]UEM23564.1 MBL fold metallo-hydrolase [Skermanella mucosa]
MAEPAMNRRALLGTAAAMTAAAAAGPLVAGSAQAQGAPPQANAQLPGAFRYKVGSFEVTSLFDGYGTRPMNDQFVVNAPLDQVQEALRDAFRPTDSLRITYTPAVVHTGSQIVLLDAGSGGKLGPTTGMMSRNMAAAGIEPASITTLVISHFHGDHISGIKGTDNSLAFPNAEILVPEAEWAYWMDDGEMSRAPAGRKPAFELVRSTFGDLGDRVRRYKSDEEIIPGFTAVEAHGHTPGHTALQISSGNETVMALADTTNVPFLFVRNPDWSAVFDMDADMARATRRRLLDRIAADRVLAFGYHWGLPNAGHIRREGSGYEFAPLNYVQTL